MSNKKLFITLAAVAITFLTCTIAKMYGPFTGKVVDAATGEPIQEAVVLIAFYTKSATVGGWSWSFADAIETLTDGNGDFYLPQKLVYSIRALAFWDKECVISIFKPGYGAFPNHPKVFSIPKLRKSIIIPENEYISFYLPKLTTSKERKENILYIEMPGGITNDKMTLLLRMKKEERRYLFGS